MKELLLQGCLVTGDAMYCQREFCQLIIDSGGDYLFVVKGNQPELKEAILVEFRSVFSQASEAERQCSLSEARTSDKGHGRHTRRQLQASTRLAAYLDWPDLAQVCRLAWTTVRNGKTTVEVQFAIITSVPRARADAARLLDARRGHWGIENRLHWVRDLVSDEDHCRVNCGHGPQNFAAFRNAAINSSASPDSRKSLPIYAASHTNAGISYASSAL